MHFHAFPESEQLRVLVRFGFVNHHACKPGNLLSKAAMTSNITAAPFQALNVTRCTCSRVPVGCGAAAMQHGVLAQTANNSKATKSVHTEHSS